MQYSPTFMAVHCPEFLVAERLLSAALCRRDAAGAPGTIQAAAPALPAVEEAVVCVVGAGVLTAHPATEGGAGEGERDQQEKQRCKGDSHALTVRSLLT